MDTPFASTFAPRFAGEAVNGPVYPGHGPVSTADGTRPTSPHPYSFLPHTAPSVIRTVSLFRQASSSQLRRLHYTGSYDGTRVRSRKHLARLVKLGFISRIWGIYDGAAEYIYQPADSKARTANMHTLDVTELYVRLAENNKNNNFFVTTAAPENHFNHVTKMVFDPEPSRFYSVGPTSLKPDAYIDTGRRFFLEVDRGTEYRAALAEKMRRYIAAYERWTEDRFPQVLFVCHDADRARFIQQVIKSQVEPRLFKVALFSEYLNVVAKEV